MDNLSSDVDLIAIDSDVDIYAFFFTPNELNVGGSYVNVNCSDAD